MHFFSSRLAVLTAVTLSAAFASEYDTTVIARGLLRPTGIVADKHTVYFTEIPNPGVAGGVNGVKALTLANGSVRVIHQGEPAPTNIALLAGKLYWTCKTAGVIISQYPSQPASSAEVVASKLMLPTGMAASRLGLFYTQIPTPGVGGGSNSVNGLLFERFPFTISTGEPEPYDVASDELGSNVYWTCRTAGVIIHQDLVRGIREVILTNLARPTGIFKRGAWLYWTELPTPGKSGSVGGSNAVKRFNLITRKHETINLGDPEPTDVTVGHDGTVYWTCTSAGVIVEARRLKKSSN